MPPFRALSTFHIRPSRCVRQHHGRLSLQGVPIQNLKPSVLMMEPAEDWYRCDGADPLAPPIIWSIFIQREMRPDIIVVRSVSLQNPAQVGFAEHDKVIERFATYRSNEPLDMAVLPRRARCGGAISDPHSTNAVGVNRTSPDQPLPN